MSEVRVRFLRNTLGHRAGSVAWVEATPMVETLVRVGALKWLDAPADYDEPEPEPVKPKRVRKPKAVVKPWPQLDDNQWETALDDGWTDDLGRALGDESPGG